MSSHAFKLKTANQRLTRQLNELAALVKESEEYCHPWNFPTSLKDLELFLATKPIIVKAFCKECMCALTSLKETDENVGSNIESNFEQYWEEKKGDYLLEVASEIENQLETRVVELECQEASIKQEMINETAQGNIGNSAGTSDFSSTMDRRLFGNELKIPEFTRNAAEFDSFWELFEELIHKQPYSNTEKLSILLSCCKGDAARALKMLPGTGDSYEKAVQQLKSQYQDPKRVIMTMIRKLKSLRQAKDDARSFRNTLNDVEAIIATLRRQGETVDTTLETNPDEVREALTVSICAHVYFVEMPGIGRLTVSKLRHCPHVKTFRRIKSL
ncbi:hypothetical protein ANCCAN_13279 [Ancylostoma caninum]|uniref:Uncharacterized protein n=1 Tax=Ancylostoma caninum TaxID=29170 RepID=A0A368GAR4_ANCCA|nr:hypothetical protein ANCCAN_13279 [Ancylostoma caninum]